MELSFEYTRAFGTGASPQAVHMMDNGLRFFYLDAGVVKAKEAYPNMGIYDNLAFTDKGRVCTNTGVEKPQLKKVAHYGAYGFWSAGSAHQFVMYMLPSDISAMVDSISISHTKDSPISQLSATFQNVENRLVGRARSIVQPNTRLELYFSMGSSDEIGMGRFYIDRTNVDYPKGTVSVSARNTIGKLLKDQTFDEDTTFTESDLKLNLEAVLALAGVEESFVGDPAKTWNLTFEPDVTILDGLTQVVALLSGWQIKETMDGVVGVASSADTRFDQPGDGCIRTGKDLLELQHGIRGREHVRQDLRAMLGSGANAVCHARSAPLVEFAGQQDSVRRSAGWDVPPPNLRPMPPSWLLALRLSVGRRALPGSLRLR